MCISIAYVERLFRYIYNTTSRNSMSHARFKSDRTNKTVNSRQENASVCLNPKLDDVQKQPDINYSIASLCDLSLGDAVNLNLLQNTASLVTTPPMKLHVPAIPCFKET